VRVKFYLFQNLVGVRSDTHRKVQNLRKEEILLINIAACSVPGKVIKAKSSKAQIEFTQPVCAAEGDKLTLSRKIANTYRLIGFGTVVAERGEEEED
jgi:translation initiation factor 2 subunit 3